MGWSERKALMQGTAVRTFREGVTYQATALDTPISIDGVWSDAHIEIDPNTEAPVSSTNPILDVILTDLPGHVPVDGARIVRDLDPAVVYKVIDRQSDGEGMTRLELQLAQPF